MRISSLTFWQGFLIFLILVVTPPAFTASFEIHLSKDWQKVSQRGDNAIFKRTGSKENELIVLQTYLATEDDAQTEEAFKLGDLTSSREKFLGVFGIKDYAALSVKSKAAKDHRFKTYIEIESMYRSYSKRGVKMIERQFLSNGIRYVISYLIETDSIGDRRALERTLDNVQPLWKSKQAFYFKNSWLFAGLPYVSSLASAETAPAGQQISASLTGSKGTSEVDTNITEKNMSPAEIAQKCQDIPEEKRRKPLDPSFMGLLKRNLETPKSCIIGVAENAWDMAKGAWDILKGTAKMVYDSEHRSKVTSAMGVVAAEAYKNPKEFASMVGKAIYITAAKNTGDFFNCLSSAEQIRVVCKLASNLIPVGILVKMVTKAPLTAAEAAKVATAVKEAVGTSKVKYTYHNSFSSIYKNEDINKVLSDTSTRLKGKEELFEVVAIRSDGEVAVWGKNGGEVLRINTGEDLSKLTEAQQKARITEIFDSEIARGNPKVVENPNYLERRQTNTAETVSGIHTWSTYERIGPDDPDYAKAWAHHSWKRDNGILVKGDTGDAAGLAYNRGHYTEIAIKEKQMSDKVNFERVAEHESRHGRTNRLQLQAINGESGPVNHWESARIRGDGFDGSKLYTDGAGRADYRLDEVSSYYAGARRSSLNARSAKKQNDKNSRTTANNAASYAWNDIEGGKDFLKHSRATIGNAIQAVSKVNRLPVIENGSSPGGSGLFIIAHRPTGKIEITNIKVGPNQFTSIEFDVRPNSIPNGEAEKRKFILERLQEMQKGVDHYDRMYKARP